MASTASSKLPNIPPADIASFRQHLQSSTRILALLGAGLSASSGLPTFRGAGGLWRTHDATDLAQPSAFEANPGLVWQFYSYRRHMALNAQPNKAHYALAELARKREGFTALSQNVDGLSQRAGHPASQLHLLHGNLYDVKCTSFHCSYSAPNFTDPIVPALAIPLDSDVDPTSNAARAAVSDALQAQKEGKELDISDAKVALPELAIKDLPQCPECKTGLLRPGVVWFGEMLPLDVVTKVDEWISESEKIDLILVVGTSARVFPAAAYIDEVRVKGARVAVVNIDRGDAPGGGLMEGDWFFEGDAAEVLPELLKPVIGEVQMPEGKL